MLTTVRGLPETAGNVISLEAVLPKILNWPGRRRTRCQMSSGRQTFEVEEV